VPFFFPTDFWGLKNHPASPDLQPIAKDPVQLLNGAKLANPFSLMMFVVDHKIAVDGQNQANHQG